MHEGHHGLDYSSDHTATPITCAFLWTKGTSSENVPEGCALFAKHNIEWLEKGQV
jgi:hypothetical protein